MCRSRVNGGRRCSRANQTAAWRTSIMERLARNVRVAAILTPGTRRDRLTALIERDQAALSSINEAISRYGHHVSAHHIDMPDDVKHMVDGLRERGFRCLLVGGSVRDSFDGTAPKDLDFEVYAEKQGGATFTVEDVAAGARQFGRVDEVGKSFGVLKMTLGSGTDIDLSVPRRENKTGVGHRGFAVHVDPTLSVSEAAERRDYTVNAMSYDPHLDVLIDPHDGKKDWDARTLRHVSDAFDEDPLRVLRGVQFAGRYNMTMNVDTAERCRTLREEVASLPDERKRTEWRKWATKSVRPSAGLRVLRETGWSDVVPGMSKVAEDRNVHRDVDRLAESLSRAGAPRVDRQTLMTAAVVRTMNAADARAFVGQAVEGKKAQQGVLDLASEGPLLNVRTVEDARVAALNSRRSLRERCAFGAVIFDRAGHTQAAKVAERAGVLDGPEPPMLSGEDMMRAYPTRKAGPWMKDALREAQLAQARGEFRTPEAGRAWLAARSDVFA